MADTDRAPSEGQNIVKNLRDASMVFAAAPLEMDQEAGERFAMDCDDAADHIQEQEAEIQRLRAELAPPEHGEPR